MTSNLVTNRVRLASSAEELTFVLAPYRAARREVAFVPTMGALHEGHLSLVRAAAAQPKALVVVSIFVNPTQFGPNEDFAHYPRTLPQDIALLEETGLEVVVFAPEVEDIYTDGEDLRIQLPTLSARWEGAERPGHFDGVCVVLTKLFNLVQPRWVLMGQKDFQQTVVVGRLIQNLRIPVELVVAPTLREADGLAMSSRNRYLDPVQRAASPALYQALLAVWQQLEQGRTPAEATRIAQATLERAGQLTVDYFAVVRDADLAPLGEVLESPATVILAVRLGQTRLLDNLPLR